MLEILQDDELPEEVKVSIVTKRVINRAVQNWFDGDDDAFEVLKAIRTAQKEEE
jgi:hypothetical protein